MKSSIKSLLLPLYCFNAVARAGSLVKAAAAMHLTHGAVSHQVKALEAALGARLFEKYGRGLVLTDAGQSLSQATYSAFSELEHALARVSDSTESPLVVSCEPTIAMKWLIPQLSDFYRRYPHIPIHLHTAGGPVDFERNRIDLAIRRNDFNWDGSVAAEKLCDEWIAPVCSPATAVSSSTMVLSEHRLLHTVRRPLAWADWSRSSGVEARSDKNETFEYFHLSLQAAEAGLGIAIGSILMISEDVRQERLTAPFGYVKDGTAYFILSAARNEPTNKNAAHRDIVRSWLHERIELTLGDALCPRSEDNQWKARLSSAASQSTEAVIPLKTQPL